MSISSVEENLESSGDSNKARLNEEGADFREWADKYVADRLPFAFAFAFAVYGGFGLLDWFVYPEQIDVLLKIRGVTVLALLALYLLYRGPLSLHSRIVIWAGVSLLAGSIATMTVFLGGFESRYYAGMNLILMGAPILLPVSVRTHAIAQATTLAYYLTINLMINLLDPTVSYKPPVALENAFFLVWTCVIADVAVWLYINLRRHELQTKTQLRKTMNIKERVRLRNEFFADVNNELMAPLSLIRESFEEIDRDPNSDSSREMVRIGLSSTSQLLAMIDRMLELARFGRESGMPRKRCIDLAELLRLVIASLEIRDERPRIRFYGASQPVLIEADIQQMKLALYNLLSSAIGFGDKSSDGYISVQLYKRDAAVTIEFEDNGLGIPTREFDRVLRSFEKRRFESSDRSSINSTGICLALVKEAVDAHNGRLSIGRRGARGAAIVTMTLPVGDISLKVFNKVAPPNPESASQTLINDPTRGGVAVSGVNDSGAAQILVFSTNIVMLRFLGHVLLGHYNVVFTRDRLQVEKLVRATPPALVLFDVERAEFDRGVLKNLRANSQQDTPVLAILGNSDTFEFEKLCEYVDDYILEPFRRSEIVNRVKRQLYLRTLRDL